MVVNKDYVEWNVASQLDDPESVMGYWKKIIALRKEMADLFVYGSYTAISEEETGELVLGYERISQAGQKAVVLLNFSDVEQRVFTQRVDKFGVLASNQGESSFEEAEVVLRPFGAMVFHNSTSTL
ncbi:putative alpha-glucosidase (maltase) [Penicillium verhagenii]|uniref:putative alpha-glucosidase (maltase) n=1 Tax=Penicillium verhagenii TaxID=1562060 RepID=UPI0025456D7D|nr:putative alpha-glucosidase (maltase) [Penicillium verhagenii]KAJ5938811.1 putative alpha-glucosidase (maltase) [Penicillium verhagenii]